MRTALTAVAVLALLASGCLRGSSPEANDPNEIVWALAGDTTVHEQTAKMWNDQNPDARVRIEKLPEDADGQRTQLGLELNAEGDLFDVMALDVVYTGEFAQNGWIDSLEDLRPEVEEDILEGPLRSGEFEGELFAIPYNSNAGFLYYRTDLLDEPPTTWDEAVEMGMAAAEEEGIAAYVGQGAAYEGLVVNYFELFWGAGGEVFADEENTQLSFGEGEAALTAAAFMRDAQDTGFFAPGFNTMQEDQARIAFGDGEAVFMRNWPSFYGQLKEAGGPVAENFDIARLPVFEEGANPSGLGGFNLALSAYSTKKDKALEFIKFAALNEEVQINLGKNALPPVIESAYEQLSDDPVMSLLAELLPDAHSRPPVPSYNDISVQIQQNIFPAYTGQLEPEAAVATIETELQEVLDRGRR